MTMTAEQKLVSKFYETVVNKLKGHLIDIQEGPIVYNFIFEIDKNTKTSKFSVDDEIMMPYSSNRMLITIPKETRNTILLDDLLKTKEFKKFDAILPVILGVDTFGNPFLADLYQMPHVLIGGRTGTGKTVCVKNLLKSLSVKMLPEECKFIIFDMKNEYFKQWNKDKHLFCPVITDIDDCFNQFDLILKMITDRYQILADYKVKNINEYHAKTNKRDMPFIVVVIDELCDFVAINKKQTEKFIKTICNLARAVGIHLIVTTQQTLPTVITNQIAACFATRISFKVRSKQDSMRILCKHGAEKLLPSGDMLYSKPGCNIIRIFGCK